MSRKNPDIELIRKQFFRLLWVQVLLAAIGAVNGLVSSLFAANTGLDGNVMSAIGLYAPVGSVVTAVNTVFLSGATILCGKYLGRSELDKTRSVFTLDLWIITGVSGLFAAFLLLGGILGFGADLFTDDPLLRDHLNRYIIGQALGVPPLMLGAQVASFLSLENQARRTSAASGACIAANVLFNFLFLKVGLIPDALGLALGASLGQWVFLGVQLAYYFTGKSMFRLGERPSGWSRVGEMVKIGYPGALSTGYQAIRGIIVNALILACPAAGAAGLSAFAASASVLTVFWSGFTGIVASARILISVSEGEEDRRSLVDAMRTALGWGVLIMLAVALLIAALSVPFTHLFYHAGDAPYQMTLDAFRIMPFCMPLSVIMALFVLYGQTSGKQLLVHLLSVLDGVVCVAGFTWLLMRLGQGMNSVYYANILNGVVCALAVVIYAWAARRKLPRSVEDLMVIPEGFGAPEDQRIDISVREMSQVVTVSRQVTDFCRRQGIDERRTYFASLFLEEMAGNVVDHGFHKDKKKHSVDIRVTRKGDDVILRIKDDCVPFDPARRKDLVDPADKIKNMGIRMVYKGARDVRYQNTLGLNVLTIRI